MGSLSAQVPGHATLRGDRVHSRAAQLGSNLRTILRTNVDFQEKMAPSKSLRTIVVTGNAP